MNIIDYMRRQLEFSRETFGPGKFKDSIINHIILECEEARNAAPPHDLDEWVDILTLAFTGAMRAGYTPLDIMRSLESTLERNKRRKWPLPKNENDPIEHVRK